MKESKAIVSREAAMRICQLYEETDAYGRKLRSQARIAKDLRLSEGTIYRIVNRMGAYADLPTAPEATPADMQESAQRVAELAAQVKAERPVVTEVDLQGTGSATERILALANRLKHQDEKSDSLLTELTEGKKDETS